MKRLLLGLSLLALTTLPVLAQDDCPEGYSCVEYAGQVIEIDPSRGFLQSVIVEERTLTVKDFDGTRTVQQVMVATFVSNGDTYSVDREDIVPATGMFEDAELGDVYLLEKQP